MPTDQMRVVLVAEAERAVSEMQRYIDHAQRSTRSLQRFAETATRTGRQLTTFVTAPIVALGTGMVKMASDAAETRNMFNVVFKDMADDVAAWAEEYAQATNRSSFENIRFLASVQDTLVPMGLMRDEAAGLSKEIVTLATDISSFKNVRTEEVMRNITSALVGNHEAVRSYGVSITEARLKQEALTSGLTDNIKELSNQEKLMLRLKLLFSDTTDAQGDAINTANQFANSLKGLRAQAEAVAIEFGELLLPEARKLVDWALEAVQYIRDLTDEQKQWLIQTMKIAAVVGPAILFLGGFARALVGINTALVLLRVALTAHPIMLLVGVLAGLAAAAPHVNRLLEAMGVGAENAAKQFSVLGREIEAFGDTYENAQRQIGDQPDVVLPQLTDAGGFADQVAGLKKFYEETGSLRLNDAEAAKKNAETQARLKAQSAEQDQQLQELAKEPLTERLQIIKAVVETQQWEAELLNQTVENYDEVTELARVQARYTDAIANGWDNVGKTHLWLRTQLEKEFEAAELLQSAQDTHFAKTQEQWRVKQQIELLVGATTEAEREGNKEVFERLTALRENEASLEVQLAQLLVYIDRMRTIVGMEAPVLPVLPVPFIDKESQENLRQELEQYREPMSETERILREQADAADDVADAFDLATFNSQALQASITTAAQQMTQLVQSTLSGAESAESFAQTMADNMQILANNLTMMYLSAGLMELAQGHSVRGTALLGFAGLSFIGGGIVAGIEGLVKSRFGDKEPEPDKEPVVYNITYHADGMIDTEHATTKQLMDTARRRQLA